MIRKKLFSKNITCLTGNVLKQKVVKKNLILAFKLSQTINSINFTRECSEMQTDLHFI